MKVNVHNVDHSLYVIAQHMDVKSTIHCTLLSSLIEFLRTLARCDIALNELQFTEHKRFHFLVQMGHKQSSSANSTRSDTVHEQPSFTLTPKLLIQHLQCIKAAWQTQHSMESVFLGTSYLVAAWTQGRSQNTADARAQHGHTTFASSLVPRLCPAFRRLQYGKEA